MDERADDRRVRQNPDASLRALVEAVGVARLAWGTAALVLAAAGLAAAFTVIRHERLGDAHERIAVVTLAGLFCGGAALAGLRLLEQRRMTMLPLGLALPPAAAATFALATIAIWREDVFDLEPWNFWRALVTGLALTLAGLVVAPLWLLVDLRPLVVRVPFLATAVATASSAAVGLVALWRWDPEGTTRATTRDLVLRAVIGFAAAAVAAMFATVAADRAVRARPRPVEPRPGA